jgi:uncharacterized membrane protein
MARRTADAAAFASITAAAIVYAAASMFRHNRFASNAYDLGIFDQSVWAFSHLEFTLDNTVRGTPTPFIDHFQPILLLLAPLYALWSDPRLLLAAQAVLVASAGSPLYLWLRRRTAAEVALLVLASYLSFWAVLAGVLFDFHELAFAAPILALGVFAALERRDALLWAATGLAMLVREDLPLTFAALGAYVALAQRRKRVGLAVAAVSVGWFLFAVNVVVPELAGTSYEHWAYYPSASESLSDPLGTAKLLVTPSDKITAFFNLVAPWLLLPFASPVFVVAVPTLLERFLSSKPAHWQQGFHYSLALAPVLAFAAADVLRRLRGRPVLVVAAAMLSVGLFFTLYRMRPFAELRRYPDARRVAEIRECLAVVPRDASVTATSALVPHLSTRRTVRLLQTRRLPRTEYLATDYSTWTFPLDAADVRAVVATARRAGYRTVCERGPTVVLARQRPG